MPRTSGSGPEERPRDAPARWRWAGLVVLVLAVLFSLFTSVHVVGPAAVFAVIVAAAAAASDIVRVGRRDRRR